MLTEGASEVIRRPGFVSVTILAGLDAQRSRTMPSGKPGRTEAQTDPAAAAYAERAAAIGTASDAMYRVAAEIR